MCELLADMYVAYACLVGSTQLISCELLTVSLVLLVGKHLAKTGLVKGDSILAGSNFIFSTNRNGHFSAEGTVHSVNTCWLSQMWWTCLVCC